MRVLLLIAALLVLAPAIAATPCERCSADLAERMARCDRGPPAIKQACIARLEGGVQSCNQLCGGKRPEVTLDPALTATAPARTAPEAPEDIAANATPEQVRVRMTEKCVARANPLVDCDCMGKRHAEKFQDPNPSLRPRDYHQSYITEEYCPQKDAAVLNAGLFKHCDAKPGVSVVNKKAFCTCMAENMSRRFLENPRLARSSTLRSEALEACK
jgi:hypothetical protein